MCSGRGSVEAGVRGRLIKQLPTISALLISEFFTLAIVQYCFKGLTSSCDGVMHLSRVRIILDNLRAHGYIPRWNPYWYFGIPLLRVYSPLSYYMMALSGWVLGLSIPEDVHTLMVIFSSIIFSVGSVSTFLLAKELGLSPVGCLASSVLFVTSSNILAYWSIGSYPNMTSIMFVPLALALYIRAVKRPSAVNIFMAGLSYAVVFLAYSLHALVLGGFTIILSIIMVIQRPELVYIARGPRLPPRYTLRLPKVIILVVSVALGLSMWWILPFTSAIRNNPSYASSIVSSQTSGPSSFKEFLDRVISSLSQLAGVNEIGSLQSPGFEHFVMGLLGFLITLKRRDEGAILASVSLILATALYVSSGVGVPSIPHWRYQLFFSIFSAVLGGFLIDSLKEYYQRFTSVVFSSSSLRGRMERDVLVISIVILCLLIPSYPVIGTDAFISPAIEIASGYEMYKLTEADFAGGELRKAAALTQVYTEAAFKASINYNLKSGGGASVLTFGFGEDGGEYGGYHALPISITMEFDDVSIRKVQLECGGRFKTERNEVPEELTIEVIDGTLRCRELGVEYTGVSNLRLNALYTYMEPGSETTPFNGYVTIKLYTGRRLLESYAKPGERVGIEGGYDLNMYTKLYQSSGGSAESMYLLNEFAWLFWFYVFDQKDERFIPYFSRNYNVRFFCTERMDGLIYRGSGLPLEYEGFNSSLVEYIDSRTKLILFIGDLSEYTMLFEAISPVNPNDIVMVYGGRRITSIEPSDLKRFNAVYMGGLIYRDAGELQKIEETLVDYIRDGGGLILDTGNLIYGGRMTGIPEPFPVTETNIIAEPVFNLTTTTKHAILEGIDLTELSSVEDVSLSYAIDLKGDAEVILEDNGRPVIALKEGGGKALWIGLRPQYYAMMRMKEGDITWSRLIVNMLRYVSNHITRGEGNVTFDIKGPEEITINVTKPQKNGALWIKMIYYPGWKAEYKNASKILKIFIAGPGMMLIFPEEAEKLTIICHFDKTLEEQAGELITLTTLTLSIIATIGNWIIKYLRAIGRRGSRWDKTDHYGRWIKNSLN
ncbi:hypothetical protein DRO55_03735 [Candidatus Bathyarchaeota archaeon]|nr:MAG: hypothetical protein DRO55_03735 [Candidatus Bathyarchaeota archaeon]